ncbi:hypothetical protein J7L13_01605, partial [bacterium]|nr:hypothetical protein [bacterium]
MIDFDEYSPPTLWEREEKKEFPRPKLLVFLLLSLAFLVLGGRAFVLQILKHQYFSQLASGNRLRRIYLLPPRGLILDRNGKQLAFNRLAFSLVVSPQDLPQDKKKREKIYREIEKVLHLQIAQEAEDARKKEIQELAFPLDIDYAQALILKERWANLAGIKIEERLQRAYLPGFAHILGYLGKIEAKEWDSLKKKGYLLFEWVGKAGLEKVYQDYLRGTPGAK